MNALIAILVATTASPAPSKPCTPELVSSAPGEGQTMFHGLSPDGRELAVGWERGSGSTIQRGAFVLDLRSGKRTELPHLNNAASFSKDGRFLVAANYSVDAALKTEVVELDRKAGTARTLHSSPATEWLASYSSDGRWILFNSMRTGGSDLYRVERISGKVERLSESPRYEAHGQYFDRDRKILFHRNVSGDDYDVAILDLATGRSKAVGATPLEEAYPAISSDGRWIAYSAIDAPGKEVNLYVMGADGNRRVRLTTGAEKDAYATWSPDGKYIYFVRFGPSDSRIYRVRMGAGRCLR